MYITSHSRQISYPIISLHRDNQVATIAGRFHNRDSATKLDRNSNFLYLAQN